MNSFGVVVAACERIMFASLSDSLGGVGINSAKHQERGDECSSPKHSFQLDAQLKVAGDRMFFFLLF